VILSNDGLPFVRDISCATNKIVDHIATKYNLSSQAVRDILCGLQHKAQEAGELKDDFGKACMELVADIMETLRYYAIQEGHPIDKMLICGGFARVSSFLEFLSDQLPLKVELWNPFKNMRWASDTQSVDIIKEQGHSLALAAGLAMRTI